MRVSAPPAVSEEKIQAFKDDESKIPLPEKKMEAPYEEEKSKAVPLQIIEDKTVGVVGLDDQVKKKLFERNIKLLQKGVELIKRDKKPSMDRAILKIE